MQDHAQSEIRNYLLSKKLPIDVLMEVENHFVSEIEDRMSEEHLTFEEAFAKTKERWRPELSEYWDGSWDLTDKSRLMRNVARQIWSSTIKTTGLYLLAVYLFIFISAHILNAVNFRFAIMLVLISASLFSGNLPFLELPKIPNYQKL